MIVGKGTGAIISRIPSYNTAPAEGAAIGRSDFASGVLCRSRKKGLEEKEIDVVAIAIASGRFE